jgi:hypothetical protein
MCENGQDEKCDQLAITSALVLPFNTSFGVTLRRPATNVQSTKLQFGCGLPEVWNKARVVTNCVTVSGT